MNCWGASLGQSFGHSFDIVAAKPPIWQVRGGGAGIFRRATRSARKKKSSLDETPPPITARLSVVEQNDTLKATCLVGTAASAAIIENDDEVAARASVTIAASFALVEQPDVIAGRAKCSPNFIGYDNNFLLAA